MPEIVSVNDYLLAGNSNIFVSVKSQNVLLCCKTVISQFMMLRPAYRLYSWSKSHIVEYLVLLQNQFYDLCCETWCTWVFYRYIRKFLICSKNIFLMQNRSGQCQWKSNRCLKCSTHPLPATPSVQMSLVFILLLCLLYFLNCLFLSYLTSFSSRS